MYLIKKLDDTLETKEINQKTVFQANRLMVQDLLILDYGFRKMQRVQSKDF